MDYSSDTSTISLRDILYILFENIRSILLLTLTTTVLVTALVSFWPETYEATAKILVTGKRTNSSLSPLPASGMNRVTSGGVSAEDINSEIEILHNYQAAEKVLAMVNLKAEKKARPATLKEKFKAFAKSIYLTVSKAANNVLYSLNLKKKIPEKEAMISKIMANLSVSRMKSSDVIEVSLRWNNPATAKKILEKLLQLYMGNHLKIRRATDAYNLLNNQIDIIEKRLKDSYRKVDDIKRKLGITSYKERESFLTSNIGQLENELIKIKIEISSINGRIEGIKSKLDPSKKVSPDKNSRNRLIHSSQLQSLIKKYPEIMLKLDIRLSELSAKRESIEKQYQLYVNELKKLNRHQTELDRLNRQISVDQDNVRYYRKQLEEARVIDVLDKNGIVNSKIITSPRADLEPAKPRKLLLIGIAFFLSLLAGTGYAFISDFFNHTIRRKEHVQKYLGIPVFATIPDVNK